MSYGYWLSSKDLEDPIGLVKFVHRCPYAKAKLLTLFQSSNPEYLYMRIEREPNVYWSTADCAQRYFDDGTNMDEFTAALKAILEKNGLPTNVVDERWAEGQLVYTPQKETQDESSNRENSSTGH